MKYSYQSGSFYEGEAVDGKFQGHGIFHFHNGDIYEGNFENDMFQGVGEYRYCSGDVYRGSFLNDMFHGVGTFSFTNGAIEKGKFHQDKRVGKFIHMDENEYFVNIYDRDQLIKCEPVELSSVTEEKKPKKFM